MTTITEERSGIDRFKLDMGLALSQHNYFRDHIYPRMREGVEFYTIQGKRSLSKAGSEFLCALYSISIIFTRDTETLESFKSVDGLVAFIATLKRGEQVVGQGRGCALLSKNGGDYNKTVKMAQKSAAIDGTLRAVGISAYFSQDLENMSESDIRPNTTVVDMSPDELSVADDRYNHLERVQSEEEGEEERIPISDRQKAYLHSLAMDNLDDGAEKETYLANIETLSRGDASEAIKGMLALAGR